MSLWRNGGRRNDPDKWADFVTQARLGRDYAVYSFNITYGLIGQEGAAA